MKCEKCGDELKYEEHHIIPKDIGGKDSDGRVGLCKKCHDIIHKMLLGVIWTYIPEKDKGNAKFAIKGFTEWFIKKGLKK